jgi:hypothetical protein
VRRLGHAVEFERDGQTARRVPSRRDTEASFGDPIGAATALADLLADRLRCARPPPSHPRHPASDRRLAEGI